MKYAWIQGHAREYGVTQMCKAFKVSRGGYYDWRGRKPSSGARKRLAIGEEATRFHLRSHGIYGHRKVHQDLLAETPELSCSRETLRKVMAELGLFSRVKRRFVRTTDSKHRLPVAANILDRDFIATGPNQKWVADITYIRTLEGWLYLAGIMDLWSRRIVGWSMADQIDAALVCDALAAALMQRRPGAGLLHHSDRGVQYAAEDFQTLLQKHGIECSMSRKGNCWDNACQESFFGKVKAEWIQDRIYATRDEAKQDVFWYIEVFYNRQRRHASLGYVSPADFEAGIMEGQVA